MTIHTLESNDSWVMFKHSFVLMFLHSLFSVRYSDDSIHKARFCSRCYKQVKMLIILETFVPVVIWIHYPKTK